MRGFDRVTKAKFVKARKAKSAPGLVAVPKKRRPRIIGGALLGPKAIALYLTRIRSECAVVVASRAFVKAAMSDHPAAFFQAWGAPQGQKLRVAVQKLEAADKALRAFRR